MGLQKRLGSFLYPQQLLADHQAIAGLKEPLCNSCAARETEIGTGTANEPGAVGFRTKLKRQRERDEPTRLHEAERSIRVHSGRYE